MTDKELSYQLGVHRSTLHRWRTLGAPSEPGALALWAQEEEAAKRLHIPSRFFHGFPRAVREKLLAAATDLASSEYDHLQHLRPRRSRRRRPNEQAC